MDRDARKARAAPGPFFLSSHRNANPCSRQKRKLVCRFASGRVLLQFGAMRLFCLLSILAGLASDAGAAQINFDFSKDTPGQMPPGFVSLVTGDGQPANWKVVEESVPPTLAPLTDKARYTV